MDFDRHAAYTPPVNCRQFEFHWLLCTDTDELTVAQWLPLRDGSDGAWRVHGKKFTVEAVRSAGFRWHGVVLKPKSAKQADRHTEKMVRRAEEAADVRSK